MENGYKSIWLVCVNDLHAGLEESKGFPGAGKLVAQIKAFCRKNKNVIVLFGGDNYKGDPVSEYLMGRPVSDLMHILDVKASVLGNHEFDFGINMIKQWQIDGGYQFLAANLVDIRTGKNPDFVKPFIVLDVLGINIMVIGLALQEELATVDRPKEMNKYAILDREKTIEEVLKIQRGTDKPINATIVLSHYGLRYKKGTDQPIGSEVIELCKRVDSLDGMFAAHLHQFMALRINGVAVSQGGCKTQGFAWIKLDFDDNNKLLKATPGYNDLREVQAALVSDKEMQHIWDSSKKNAMSKLGKTIAVLKTPIVHRNSADFEVNPEGTPLSFLATQIMCRVTGCSISLFYSGRIGQGFRTGNLTLYEVYQTLFFENGIVTMCLTGRTIRENIEIGLRTLIGDGASPIAVGGLIVKVDYSRPYGNRIIHLSLEDGGALELNKKYDVAMDEFLADNSINFDFTSAENIFYTGISLRDRMIEQIERDGIIEEKCKKSIINVVSSK